MEIGDFVGRITNDWQKHNKWMEFPDEKPEPFGLIIGQARPSSGTDFWDVLTSSGDIECFSEKYLVVINESR
jgi:hypothetical protein